MIYLQLFLTFLKIGAVAFGGGYGMIPMIREDVLSNSWLTEEELLNFIAVAESTPGPIAVNMATFVGSSQGGLLGAFLATLGVILPAFLIMLLIVMFLNKLLEYAGVKAVLMGIRPAFIGLIIATSLTMFLSIIFGIGTIKDIFSFDWKGLAIFMFLSGVFIGYKLLRNKYISPIILILISAVLGILLY